MIGHGVAIRKIKIYLHPAAQRIIHRTCDVGIVTGPHENRCKYHRWCEKRACKVDNLQKKVEGWVKMNPLQFKNANLRNIKKIGNGPYFLSGADLRPQTTLVTDGLLSVVNIFAAIHVLLILFLLYRY